jgi:nucleoid-associated protein EbfC
MSDLNKMMEQLKGIQERFAQVQEELGKMTATAETGGGMVKVTANGRQEVISIKIDKEVIDPAEPEMLEDLVVGAVNQALRRAKELSESQLSEAARGFMPPGFPQA